VSPRQKKVIRGNDLSETPVKLFFFGPWGSGKTYTAVDLLRAGYKIVMLVTDIGGSGSNSIRLALRKAGQEELLNNFVEIVLDDEEEVEKFIYSPTVYMPDIYDFDPDFLFWDGFGSWQQVYLSEKIGSMAHGSDKRELPEAVEEGLQFETAQWGQLRNATFRRLHKFCTMRNTKTGKVWHKILTAQEGVKSKSSGPNQSELVETHIPLLQGAGGKLAGGAFDLIIRTVEKVDKDGGKTTRKYVYEIKGDNAMSKNRGFDLPNVLPADMGKLWEMISDQLGLKKKEKGQ